MSLEIPVSPIQVHPTKMSGDFGQIPVLLTNIGQISDMIRMNLNEMMFGLVDV